MVWIWNETTVRDRTSLSSTQKPGLSRDSDELELILTCTLLSSVHQLGHAFKPIRVFFNMGASGGLYSSIYITMYEGLWGYPNSFSGYFAQRACEFVWGTFFLNEKLLEWKVICLKFKSFFVVQSHRIQRDSNLWPFANKANMLPSELPCFGFRDLFVDNFFW